jgi:hypothetical protein
MRRIGFGEHSRAKRVRGRERQRAAWPLPLSRLARADARTRHPLPHGERGNTSTFSRRASYFPILRSERSEPRRMQAPVHFSSPLPLRERELSEHLRAQRVRGREQRERLGLTPHPARSRWRANSPPSPARGEGKYKHVLAARFFASELWQHSSSPPGNRVRPEVAGPAVNLTRWSMLNCGSGKPIGKADQAFLPHGLPGLVTSDGVCTPFARQ